MPPAPPEVHAGPDAASAEVLLRQGCSALGLDLADAATECMLRHLELLGRWNRAFNLTRIAEPLEAVPLHVLDSLAVRGHVTGDSLIDVGSGAGFPGMPLAICSPGRRHTLLDSRGKKTRFLDTVVRECQLQNVSVVQERAERYRPGRKFDTLVARAYGSLRGIVDTCIHLVAPGGRIVAMKGEIREREIDELGSGRDLEFRIEAIDVPFLDAVRHVVIIEPGYSRP